MTYWTPSAGLKSFTYVISHNSAMRLLSVSFYKRKWDREHRKGRASQSQMVHIQDLASNPVILKVLVPRPAVAAVSPGKLSEMQILLAHPGPTIWVLTNPAGHPDVRSSVRTAAGAIVLTSSTFFSVFNWSIVDLKCCVSFWCIAKLFHFTNI